MSPASMWGSEAMNVYQVVVPCHPTMWILAGSTGQAKGIAAQAISVAKLPKGSKIEKVG